MSYEYEEVIQLIVKTDQMNADLAKAKTLFEKGASEIGKLDVKINAKDFAIDLNKIELARIRSEERVAKVKLKIQEDAIKRGEALRSSSAKADIDATKAAKRQDLEEAKALYRYRREMDKETFRAEREEAKALHRYRMEMDKERAQAQARQAKEATQFNNIFSPGGRPLAITPGATAAPGGLNASAILRTAAGGAGALGAYPAAGALYASANAMQALGVSTISATTALTVFAPALAAIGAAFVAYKFVEWGAEFSRELARMSTLMLSTKASAEEFSTALDRTAQSALKISSAFNLDAVDVVKAFKEALSSGIDVSDLERFATTAATLSVATQTSIQDTINLLTSIKDAYGFSVGEMAHQSDLLFNSINVGKIHLKDYVNGFARLADAGNAAGVKIEELHDSIDGMTRVGMPANRTMTSMVALIHALENPSEKMIKAMGEMGLSLEDINLRGRDFVNVVDSISRATKGGVGSEIGKLFEDERARQAIKSNIRAANVIKNEIIPANKELGTSAVAAGRAMSNLSDDIGKMMTQMSNAITSKSHGAGTWLDGILFGTPAEKAATDKALQDQFEKMKMYAKSALTRGLGEEVAGRNISAVVKRRTTADGIGFDQQVREGQMYEPMKLVAIQYALGEIKDDAVKSVREIDEMFKKTIIDASLLLDKMAKPASVTKLSRVDTKELNARATDDQKQKLLDLESEIEDQKELLTAKKEQLAVDIEAKQIAFAKEKINPLEDQINAAMREGGDKGTISGLNAKLADAKKEFAKFSEAAKDELTNTDAFNPFLAKIFDLTLTIETMRARISTQDTTKAIADKKEAVDKADKAAQKTVEEFNSIAERLYKDDVANYERAQKDRASIFKKINKEIESAHKRTSEIQANVTNNILKSQLAARSDDPAAQARIARGAKDTALDQLKLASAGGDRNAFESALKKFEAASDAVQSAMSQIDNRRAQRVYQDDQNTLGGLANEFDKNFTSAETTKANSMSSRDNSVSIRSPQQIAKDAAKEMADNKEITKVVLEAKVNLQIDGELSEKTKNELTTKIIDKVKQSWSNRNPAPSTYDPSSRTSRSVVSPNASDD